MGRRSGKAHDAFRWSDLFGPEIAEKLMDTGNLVLGGLVLAQFLGSGTFDWRLAVVGGVAWLVLFGLACGLLYHHRGEDI